MNKRKDRENQLNTNKPETLRELIPIKRIKNDIVITQDDEFILLIEVLPINFKLKSQNEQEFIVRRYEELFKILKVPFSIFTIARKADSKEHITFLQNYLQTEENENMREMMREYMAFVQDISYKNAITKRFIVALPYSGFDSNEDAKMQWLMEKRSVFVDAITRCGNKVVEMDPADRDRFTAGILYQLLNPKASEIQRMVTL